MQKLAEVCEKLNATNEAYIAANIRTRKAKLAFEEVTDHFISLLQ